DRGDAFVSAKRKKLAQLPLPVLRKDEVSRLRSRVAREPALGVVSLWRRAGGGAWREGIRRRVSLEPGVSPSAAIREPLAVLLHEVHVQQIARSCRVRKKRVLLRLPVDLGHLGSVWNRLAVAGNTGVVGIDHRRIA